MNKKFKFLKLKRLVFLPVILTPLVLASCGYGNNEPKPIKDQGKKVDEPKNNEPIKKETKPNDDNNKKQNTPIDNDPLNKNKSQKIIINSEKIEKNENKLINQIELTDNKFSISSGNGIDSYSVQLMKKGTPPFMFEGINWMYENSGSSSRQRRHSFFNENKWGVIKEDFENLSKLIKINGKNVVIRQVTKGIPNNPVFYRYDGMQTEDKSVEFTLTIKNVNFESSSITMDLVLNGKDNLWSATVSSFKFTNAYL
ncbi:hypothetical protein [Mycoplasma sp. E35C]|uniref:hypothetical protein n=1 Tax=Mycoplasma sp. E35C TaxID=2801918 RepID=UPI001CA459FD|nr:hypothetical protein [Mycoplasma sp. E35C]QZX48908.1 hypothetical protein JJE79_02515 [Mycoplasma sp. E35C]